MQKNAKIYGKLLNVTHGDQAFLSDTPSKFELSKCIAISSNRSENKPHEIKFDENDLLALKFSDDTEWIGHPEDIQELYGTTIISKRDSQKEYYQFDSEIFEEDKKNRSVGVKRAVIKLFSVFKPKAPAKLVMKQLGITYDKKVQPDPGLFKVDSIFKKTAFRYKEKQGGYLLLLHGTLSNTEGSFGGLMSNNTFNEIITKYSGNVIALEHFTLSQSPLENALYFLQHCPEDFAIDILSHSRGGLIADILAKCDFNNSKANLGFNSAELRIVAGKDKASHDLMLEINKLALAKRLRVNKVIRIAAPASGTSILSRRIDHFFNLLLNTISLAFGISHPIYALVKSFLLELIAQKEDPEALPGLNSMMPESYFQKMMNSASTLVSSKLFVIAGDSEVSGINLGSLKVLLANLFYQVPNDLVVDTKRMTHGVSRLQPINIYLSKDGETSHFNYFINKNTCTAILKALDCKVSNTVPEVTFTKRVYAQGQRGILLDWLSLDGINFSPDKVTRDVLLVLPGIMGSTLASNGKDQWIQMRELNDGAIVNQLSISNPSVEASGVVEKFYGKMGRYFSERFDVITLAFDWRKTLADAATALQQKLDELLALQNIKIHIVAHSMGGLVARQCMIDHSKTWSQFSSNDKNKLILLGTPWLGSYLVMEVLTGHSRRVKQLAMLDFDHDRKDLLKVFWNYPGVFELLPLEQNTSRDFWDPNFWKAISDRTNSRHMPNPKLHGKSLSTFGKYRTSILQQISKMDNSAGFFKNVYYICGKANETVFDYTFKNKFLSKHQKLVYKATSEGDGSVTWKSGIPQPLRNSTNLYYTTTGHGDLANEEYIFEGISDILDKGNTSKLMTHPPLNRNGEVITEIYHDVEPLQQSELVVNAIFDLEKTEIPPVSEFNVKVINADLEMASFPVMVGHFFMDLILSAEKALDDYLNGRLSQRLGIGYYPGKVGESEIFFNLKTQPKGAIICGLGAPEKLTSFLLAKTVKLATLKYAMFMRDNYTLPEAKMYAEGISCMLIGIGYGKLPVEDSLKGILLGIASANAYMEKVGDGLRPIRELEIINYYESVASEAYYDLSKMRGRDNRIGIQLHKGIVKRPGAKKKKLFASMEYDWWYNLHITSQFKDLNLCASKELVGFKYYSSKGLARIEEEMIGIGMLKVYHLLELHSQTHHWNKHLSKTLFEMLIPNEFKDVFRNQGNMVLKVDKSAAEIPWELLHDTTTDDTPVAVTSSFVRQLITSDGSYARAVPLGVDNVLVVGDPLYNEEKLPPLPAAKNEAEWVAKRLSSAHFPTVSLIQNTADSIIRHLYNQTYKIMHFAGHGLYEPESDRIGIAIGDGIFIDPPMLKQMGYVPEFVFINCCYSGTITSKEETYYQNRFKLAANIGTELIDMGVKAIIVTGWAVDDHAALTFSETFYTSMLEGYDFGSSVQRARLGTYQNHPHTNTWGAYQCYGNPFFKFNNRQKGKVDDLEYVVSHQVHTDLDNLLGSIRDSRSDVENTLSKLQHFLEKADRANLLDAVVLEKEALIYDELGETAIAHEKFLELFKFENGNFSIEALEKYCILKTYEINVKNAKDYLQEIELLTLVGKNPKRLTIVANAYKIASLTAADADKLQLLNQALECYRQAFVAAKNKFDGAYLDAITNIIFIGYILEINGKGTLAERLNQLQLLGKGVDVPTYLINFYQTLKDYDLSDSDISVQIGMTETKYCLMLLKNDFKPDLDLDIISKYEHIFNLMYSPRYIRIELRQIDFLLHYIQDKGIRKQLQLIRKAVEQLL